MKRLPGCQILLLIAMGSAIGSVERSHGCQTELNLENGIHVRLLPLPTAKTNALVVLYGLGNRNDPPGISGLAHLAEHLYVTAATENTPARNVQQYMSHYPDGWNAQTGDDYTVFATVFQPGRTADELTDAADRMRSVIVNQADLDRELPRIEIELRNMYQGYPPLALGNHGRHQARPLPYAGRRGGRIEELKTVPVKTVQTWLDEYYKPENAVIVLAGVFDPETVRTQIEAQFASIGRGRKPPVAEMPAPAKNRLLEIGLTAAQPAEAARVGFTFSAPGVNDRLYAAFLVHAVRLQLAGMKSAKNMQEIPYVFRPLDDPDFFYVSGAVQQDETSKQALERLEASLARELAAPLLPHHVKQAENQLALFLDTRDLPGSMKAMNPYGMAFATGRRRQLGLNSEKLRQNFAAVDSGQMRLAAKKFFSESGRVSVIARPVR